MAYEALARASSETPRIEDEVFVAKSLEYSERPWWPRTRPKNTVTVLHVYAAIVTVLLCISVLIHLVFWVWGYDDPNQTPETVQRTYGRDVQYMSLDHQFDPLWNAWANPTELEIRVSDDELGTGQVPTIISV
jgi:hypothetical protein